MNKQIKILTMSLIVIPCALLTLTTKSISAQ